MSKKLTQMTRKILLWSRQSERLALRVRWKSDSVPLLSWDAS